VGEFAELAGVTVRALHHYDRLGLLRPLHRSDRGYRLYVASDLAKLEQIVVLKYLGLPLKDIKSLIRRNANLPDALRRQQMVLVSKRQRLDETINAIAAAEASLRQTNEPDWSLFRRIIKEVEMQNDNEWTKKYYSPEAQIAVEGGKSRWSPELQERVSKQWNELYADVERAMAAGETPDGPVVQALAARWKALVGEFTRGHRAVQQGLNTMWADQANWPAAQKQQFATYMRPEIMSFMMEALKGK